MRSELMARFLVAAGFGLLLAALVSAVLVPWSALAQNEAASEVQIQNFAFNPANITVAVGGSVTWTNRDQAPHTATSQAFDTGVIAPGSSFSIQFDTPGEIAYICGVHGSSMSGTVVVE
jgi:plastocyanin